MDVFMDTEPTADEAAALLKSADFITLVANLLDCLGQDRSGVWALADMLYERGFHRAAWMLRGRADGEVVDWTISGLSTREELPPGHRRKRVFLKLEAIGTVNKPLWPDDDDDDEGFPARKTKL